MNKLFRALIGFSSLGVLIAFAFMPVITLFGDSITFRNIIELTIEVVKDKVWESLAFFGLFALLVGIPVLCFLILAIVHLFKLLAKPQKIRVGNQVFTALFFLLFLIFLPKLLGLLPDTAPDWFPEEVYGYLLIFKNNQDMFQFGPILFIAIGACVVIFLFKIFGNVSLKATYKAAGGITSDRNDFNQMNYCSNCGNTVSSNDRFCKRCGERI
jgi:hypothetical protein